MSSPTIVYCNVCDWTAPARRGDIVLSTADSAGECTKHEVFRP